MVVGFHGLEPPDYLLEWLVAVATLTGDYTPTARLPVPLTMDE